MSRGNTSPIYHSANRMKKTMTLAKMSTPFLDQFVAIDAKFLGICILTVVGPDTVVGSASGNLLIV